MKTQLLLLCFVCALSAARAASTAAPRELAPPVAAFDDDTVGLLGQTYSGLEFGYTHHVESAPRSLRRFGFVSSRPLPEAGPNVDAAFRYNYTRGSTAGGHRSLHDLAASFVGYLPIAEGRPFLRGDLGWAWERGLGGSDSSFLYVIGTGIELVLTPRVAFTPYLNYQDAPDMDARAVWFGARTSYRFDPRWTGTLAVQVDDEHNIEYAVGVMRRF